MLEILLAYFSHRALVVLALQKRSHSVEAIPATVDLRAFRAEARIKCRVTIQ